MLGMVGLAGDTDDGQRRVGVGEAFRVWAGSEATHAELVQWCARIEAVVREQGRVLQDLTEQEFLEIVSSLDGTQLP